MKNKGDSITCFRPYISKDSDYFGLLANVSNKEGRRNDSAAFVVHFIILIN